MRRRRSATGRRPWLAALLLIASASLAAADGETVIRVRYRTADTVYLDAGRLAGLAEGDRLVAVRDGSVIAELEVTFVADHSASCHLLSERLPVEAGDLAQPLGRPEPEPPDEAPPAAVETGPEPESVPPAGSDAAPWGSSRPSRDRNRRMSLSGSLTLDWESYVDDASGGRYETDESTARLSLRARNIAGLPYDLTIRMRTRENRRLADLGGDTRTRRSDRFYELSLAYRPEDGRLSYEIGRLSAAAFSGLGYLDGALGRYALGERFQVGGFFGAAAEVESFGFESTGEKYGLFTRFATPREATGRHRYEVVLAGVREIGELDVSREYLSLQSRFSSGSRWSFYQWAEVDLNNGWRKELADSTSQLSNLVLTLMARLSPASRFTLSYNRFEQYRTEETRSIPEQLFNDLQRQGLRASLQLGRPRGLNLTLNAGLRDQEGAEEQTTSYGLSIRHPDVASWGLSLGLNLLAFESADNDGYTATLRASKRLPGGHLAHLDLGDRLSRDLLADGEIERSTQWARLGLWLELPRGLFATGEYELTTGDELEGRRLNVGFGYRF